MVSAGLQGIEQRTRQAASLLAQPSTLATALEAAQSSDEAAKITDRLSVEPDLSAGVVAFRMAGATSAEARRLGEGLSGATVEALRSSAGSLARQVAGDFEDGLDDWSSTGPAGQRASITRTPEGRYGDGALRVRCRGARGAERRGPSLAACAPGFIGPDRLGAQSGALVGPAHTGQFLDDGIIGRPRSVGERWRRLELLWTPRDEARSVVLALQSVGAGLVDLDAVALRYRRLSPEAPTVAQERARFGESAPAIATPVRIVSSGNRSTLAWGAAGAGLGLLIGLIGLIAGGLASQRITA